MKKLLLLVSAVIIIAGCSKKNDAAPGTITGKWYVTTDSIAQYINGNSYYHVTYTYDHQNYVEFNADGSGDEVFIRKTLLGGNAVDDAFAVFTYTFKGNEINYSFPDQTVGTETVNAFTQTGTVTTHTKDSLSITVIQSFTQDGNVYKQVEIENCIQ